MDVNTRRARRPDSLAASLSDLLDDYCFPVPTHAARVILGDRGRPVTAEALGRLAAYERADFLRTRLPPRLCSVIDTHANAVSPRWWARGDWRLQRRVLSDDVKLIWQASLAERLCTELANRPKPPGSEVVSLALGTIAQVLPDRYFDVPTSAEDWTTFRDLLVNAHPSVTHSLESPTKEQHDAEGQLKSTDLPAVELYFGRRHET